MLKDTGSLKWTSKLERFLAFKTSMLLCVSDISAFTNHISCRVNGNNKVEYEHDSEPIIWSYGRVVFAWILVYHTIPSSLHLKSSKILVSSLIQNLIFEGNGTSQEKAGTMKTPATAQTTALTTEAGR